MDASREGWKVLEFSTVIGLDAWDGDVDGTAFLFGDKWHIHSYRLQHVQHWWSQPRKHEGAQAQRKRPSKIARKLQPTTRSLDSKLQNESHKITQAAWIIVYVQWTLGASFLQ